MLKTSRTLIFIKNHIKDIKIDRNIYLYELDNRVKQEILTILPLYAVSYSLYNKIFYGSSYEFFFQAPPQKYAYENHKKHCAQKNLPWN